jgi:hypothetical protein
MNTCDKAHSYVFNEGSYFVLNSYKQTVMTHVCNSSLAFCCDGTVLSRSDGIHGEITLIYIHLLQKIISVVWGPSNLQSRKFLLVGNASPQQCWNCM